MIPTAERLVVLEAVDLDRLRLVGREPGQDLGRVMDRVVAAPRTGGVGRDARGHDVDPHRPLAAALDAPVGRLEEHGEVTGQQVRAVRPDPGQAVELGLDLLALVEQEGQVPLRLGDLPRDLQHDRHATLHVDRAATPQLVTDETGGQVRRAGQRHRVEVPGEDDALGAAEIRPGDHRVAIADHLEMTERPQRRLDGVRECCLVPAHRLDVADRRGERGDVTRHVENCGGPGN